MHFVWRWQACVWNTPPSYIIKCRFPTSIFLLNTRLNLQTHSTTSMHAHMYACTYIELILALVKDRSGNNYNFEINLLCNTFTNTLIFILCICLKTKQYTWILSSGMWLPEVWCCLHLQCKGWRQASSSEQQQLHIPAECIPQNHHYSSLKFIT